MKIFGINIHKRESHLELSQNAKWDVKYANITENAETTDIVQANSNFL